MVHYYTQWQRCLYILYIFIFIFFYFILLQIDIYYEGPAPRGEFDGIFSKRPFPHSQFSSVFVTKLIGKRNISVICSNSCIKVSGHALPPLMPCSKMPHKWIWNRACSRAKTYIKHIWNVDFDDCYQYIRIFIIICALAGTFVNWFT